MPQRSQMFYAYFRFYIDEDDIIAGINEYCTSWEHMYAVGYNYQEFRCFVDNIGGFEHWVGDMQGYISQTREMGFIDGSPSDNVYDSTLLMGKSKIDLPDLRYLHFLKPSVGVYIRKISATAAAEASFKNTFATGVSLSHAFYGAYDENTIEKANYIREITVSTTGTPTVEYSLDISKEHSIPSIDPASTAANPDNVIDGDWSTYASAIQNQTKQVYLDLGSITNIYNVCYKYLLYAAGAGCAYIKLYYGDTVAGCTTLIDSDSAIVVEKTVNKYEYRDLALTGRFLRFELQACNFANNRAYLYQVLVS